MALKSYIAALHLTAAGLADPDFIHISPINYLVHFKFGINLGNKTIETALLARAVTFGFRVSQSKNKTLLNEHLRSACSQLPRITTGKISSRSRVICGE